MNRICCAAVFLLTLTAALFSITGSQSPSTRDEQLIQKIKAARPYLLRGRRHFLKQDYGKAEKDIRKCLDIFPRFSDAAFISAQIAYARGEFTTALEMIEKAEADHAFMVELSHRVQSEVRERQQKQSRELEEEMRFLQSQWVSQDADCALISALSSARQRMAGLKSGEIAPFEAPADLPGAYSFVHGNILFRLQDFESSEKQYLAALQNDPRLRGAYNNLAGLLFHQRRYISALDIANQALIHGVPVDPGLQSEILLALGKPEADILEREFSDGVKQFMVNAGKKEDPLYVNCYVVFNPATRDALIIDPGAADERIPRFISERGLRVRKILNTHGHSDHIQADEYFSGLYQVSIAAPRSDAHLFPQDLVRSNRMEWIEGDGPLPVEGFAVTALHIPGHSPGSLCFLIDRHLFSGDNLFRRGIGRVWEDTLKAWFESTHSEIRGIRDKLFILSDDLPVHPGHGLATTIGEEKLSNPFFSTSSLCQLLKQSLSSEKGIVSATVEDDPGAATDMHLVFTDSAALEVFLNTYGDSLLGIKLRLTEREKSGEIDMKDGA